MRPSIPLRRVKCKWPRAQGAKPAILLVILTGGQDRSDRVPHARDEQRLHRERRHVGFHLGSRRRRGRLAGGIEDVAQDGRVARAVQKQARPAQHEVDRAPERVAVAQGFVPTELPIAAVLPSPARRRLYGLRRHAALAAYCGFSSIVKLYGNSTESKAKRSMLRRCIAGAWLPWPVTPMKRTRP